MSFSQFWRLKWNQDATRWIRCLLQTAEGGVQALEPLAKQADLMNPTTSQRAYLLDPAQWQGGLTQKR